MPEPSRPSRPVAERRTRSRLPLLSVALSLTIALILPANPALVPAPLPPLTEHDSRPIAEESAIAASVAPLRATVRRIDVREAPAFIAAARSALVSALSPLAPRPAIDRLPTEHDHRNGLGAPLLC